MLFSRLSKLCFLFALASTAVASSAPRAQETAWDASAYKDWSVSSVTVRGLDKDTAAQLRGGLALALSSGFLGTKKPVFFPQTLEKDIRRTRLFLSRRGHPHAEIRVIFEPKERQREVGVVFDIRPGPAVRVASVTVEEIPEALEEDAADVVTVSADSIFVDSEVNATAEALVSMLRAHGHAFARVYPRIEWRDSTRVAVVFNAAPGAVYYFGETNISGVDEDMVPLAGRVVTAHRGDRYDPEALEDSKSNLRVLGLFRQIRLDIEETAPDTLGVAAGLSMREPRRLETGVRYQTDEQLDVGIRWTHRNLFKRGRGGSVTMSASTLLQRAELSAWWPAVLFARSRLSGTVGIRREDEETYEQTTTGFDGALSYEWSLRTKTRWGVIVSNVSVTEKTPDADAITGQDGVLTALTASWERDRTDSPMVATRGTYVRLGVEWAPDAAFSDYHYVRLEPNVSMYNGIPWTKTVVLALRVAGGLAEPIGPSTDLLPGKRFYSGGASSMRGFNRRKLGPLDSAGAPLGGEAMFEGSAELRFPLFWRFRGTSFVDTGQVWPTIGDITARNVEVATGVGLWLNTAIGPIRSDIGYRLTTYEKTQPRWVFHFSIGPAF